MVAGWIAGGNRAVLSTAMACAGPVVACPGYIAYMHIAAYASNAANIISSRKCATMQCPGLPVQCIRYQRGAVTATLRHSLLTGVNQVPTDLVCLLKDTYSAAGSLRHRALSLSITAGRDLELDSSFDVMITFVKSIRNKTPLSFRSAATRLTDLAMAQMQQ